ncbi:UvrD-helicase domain-containing protein [Thiorhodococcus minor]|uniref:DNA 3'-5' helicase n=1 Tax=Thiorhodococcus minor TaxID=57489 RepID=A0A6M0JS89_9GAMM|nr:UvrD-helicase domain-containing protein [Thiorhodococcus minor]NEV60380.1 UvrD-helicase domain-containing protein [Thiorhodococcus minor]
MTILFRHAGAGSGKTTSIERDIGERMVDGRLQPEGLIAVTFTKKAAAELAERIGKGLLQRGRSDLASRLREARIGTVNAVCGQLIEDCCFDLGLSPTQRVVEEADQQALLNVALDAALSSGRTAELNALARRLAMDDWQGEVLALIEKARANDFSDDDLERFADRSVNELMAQLPAAEDFVDETGLRAALEQSLVAGRTVAKPTSKFQKSLEKIEIWLRQPVLTWQEWVRASKLEAGVKERGLLEPAITYGGRVLECPGFRRDMETMIRSLFDAAGMVMETFAKLKVERGLVDFVDQEQLTLRALMLPAVRDRLQQSLHYLVVDEFQDTSPIQLALFAELAHIANDVLLVGDAKQAIYGFRGSDPRLPLDVMHYVETGGGISEDLPNNYRSRPELVRLTNALFVEPFSHLLRPSQVELEPRVTSPLTHEPLCWWHLEGKNLPSRALALAGGLQKLIESGLTIVDPVTKTVRPVRASDIAVLYRNGDHAMDLAAACADRGLPTSQERAGLLETPEVTLALACLRRLADPKDSLASAEIIALESGTPGEDWLPSRLGAITAGDGPAWSDRASPTLARLSEARSEIATLTPVEALSMAIQVSGLHRTLVAWNEGRRLVEQRLANIARLTELVDDYCTSCEASGHAATVAGLILWLRGLEQQGADTQAAGAGDAVSILTYHKAKGLEWPVVICADLGADLKVSVFGPRVLASPEPFDWNAPLKGRELRYLPQPFPDQRGNDPLTQRLRDTPAWTEAETQARNEAVQLLYVGMTRARDRLILTHEGREGVGKWLDLLGSELFPLDGVALELPDGTTVQNSAETLGGSTDESTRPSRPRRWLSEPLFPPEQAPEYRQKPSDQQPGNEPYCKVVGDFGTRIDVTNRHDTAQVGSALHHTLALGLTVPGLGEEDIADILSGYDGVNINARQVLNRIRELSAWIAQHYPSARLHCELPFSWHLPSGKLQEGQIDLALELADTWVVIDHKSNPRPKSEWLGLASEHSGQLQAYAQALKALSGKPVKESLIHFSVSGGMVHVDS